MNIVAPHSSSRSGWILAGTLLISLLLHVWLLFMPQIHLALFPDAKSVETATDLVSMLKVRIAAPAPEVPVPPPVAPKPKPAPVSNVAGPSLAAPEPPPSSAPKPEVKEEVPAEGVVPVTEPESAPVVDKPLPEPEQMASAASEPLPVAPTMPAVPEPVAVESYPPLKLTVNYSLFKGKNGIKIGKIVHTWDIKNGQYVIASVVEAAGLARFLTSEMIVQTSQGRITANGLEPESYWEQRGQKADRTYYATFDYTNKTLTYGRVTEATTVPLPPGTQDQLSFIYQFGLKAPFSGTLQFSMTSGRKLGIYNTEVVGEALIKTGLGELRALHLRKVRKESSDDDVEVWLAVDHQYLPAKVRITNSDGDVLEQVVEGMQKK